MPDPTAARLAALADAPAADLRAQWRDLFGTAPPAYTRRVMASRLAYRVQELAYGGLSPATVKRLAALGAHLDGPRGMKRSPDNHKPIAGTCLMREWQGVAHLVTVTDDGYAYQGRPYKSLSAIARAITGVRWNGWIFFGLKRGAAS